MLPRLGTMIVHKRGSSYLIPNSPFPIPNFSNMLISPRFSTNLCKLSLRTVHAAMGVWKMKRWKWGEKKRAALAL